MAEVNRLEWDAYIRDSELMASVNRIERRVNGMVDNVTRSGKGMEEVFSKMAKAATAFFTVNQAQNFVQQLVKVRSEFQQLDIAFTTMLGSKEKADKLTKDLIDYAMLTPFGMKESANAAKQLLAYGSTAEDIKQELIMLGDVAAGTSQPIGELVYLYGTLRTQGRAYMMDIRQFAGRGIPIYKELAEVLKVDVSQVNAFVEAGKVGFAEVQKAFQNMTAQGSMFGGLMEAQSKTIQGELERLGDAYDMMLNKMGTQTEGTISNVIKGASVIIENYETVLNIMGALVITYGAYRAALIATAALQQVSAARAVGMTSAELLHLGAISAKTAAMKVLNAVMAANPAIFMTASILGLTAAVYALTQVTDATSAAQERLAVVQEVGAKKADEEKRSVEQLVAVIKDHTASVEQRKSAYDKLQAQTKGILSSFSQEEIAIGKASDALATYVQNIGRAASARKAFDEFNALAEQLEVINRKGIDGVGIWERTGRAMQNAFGVNGSDAAKSFWGFGDKKGDNFIVDQQKDVLKKQMDELQKEFGKEFKGFISGVEDTVKDTTPSSLFVEGLKDPIKNFNSLIRSVSNKGELDTLKKAITEKMEALAPGDSQIAGLKSKLNQIAKLEEAYSITKPKSDESIANSQFQDAERYLAAYEKITNARQQMLNSLLHQDQQEIASTKQKYDSLRDEIRKFNADPKNKTKIDVKQIDEIERRDLNEVINKQANTRKLTQYQEDYTNYLKYEQLKKEAGDQFANEQYGKYVNVVEKMKGEYAGLAARQQITGLSGADEKYFKELETLLKAHGEKEKEERNSRFVEALKLSETFSFKEQAIRKKHADAFKELEKQKTSITEKEFKERTEVLKKAQQDELKSLVESNPEYEKAMKDIDESSKWLLAEAFKRGKDIVDKIIDGMSITPQQKSELKKVYGEIFDKGAKDAEGGDLQRYEAAVSSFEQLVNSATQFDGTMSNSLKTIGSMIRQVGDLTKTLSDVGSGMSKSGTVLAVAGAIVSMIGGITEAISNARFAKREQYQNQIDYSNDYQLKQVEAITKALERQLALIQEIYGTDRVNEYSRVVKESTDAFNNAIKSFDGVSAPTSTSGVKDKNLQHIMSGNAGLVKFKLTGDSFYDDFIKKLNEGADFEKAFGKKGSKQYDMAAAVLKRMINDGMLKPIELGFSTIEDITVAKIEDLQRLIDEGKLDDISKRQAEAIINSYNILKDAMNQLREELTGVAFTSLTNGIVSMFEQGKTSVKHFTEFFEKQMQQAVLKGFSRKMIETQMQSWYEEFYKASESNGGLDAGEIENLRKAYFGIMEKANAEFEELKKLGIGLGGEGSSSQSELSKGIQSMSEKQADRVEAELGGLRLAQLALVELERTNHADNVRIMNYHLNELSAISNNTYRTANNTDRLANIETAIVQLNSKITNTDAIRRGAGL